MMFEIGDDLSLARAGRYYKTFYGTERMPVYIDGHFKAVWTLKNIPKGKHGMMDRIMPGLKQIFLNGNNGHPLLHKTCPGDRHLTKEFDYLSNANRRQKGEEKEAYPVRCALVKKGNGKRTAIVTTAPGEGLGSGAGLADLSYNRWPCQEATFKEMTRYCNLKVNHSVKKRAVFNRMAASKRFTIISASRGVMRSN